MLRSLSLIVLLATSAWAQQQPLVQLIEEAIYESNQELAKKHEDVQAIEAFTFEGYHFQVSSGGGTVGNFSTVALVGTPICSQENKQDGVSYNFDMAVRLDQFLATFQYHISYFIFSSSGTVSFKNTGNALRGKFVVNTYNGNVPCNAVLEVMELQYLGSTELEFQESGIFMWVLSKIFDLALSLSKPLITSLANQHIETFIKTPEMSSKFTEIACKPFNFNV